MLPSSSVRRRPNNDDVKNWPRAVSQPCTIRDLWASYLNLEFDTIVYLVQEYTYVSIDMELPGLLVRPDNRDLEPPLHQFTLVRDFVNMLKLILLGFSLLDENGEPAPDCSTWQFTFKFSLKEDDYAEDGIPILTEHGIQLDKH
ncbi:hypothetical protein HPB48_008766 [Haemaphysalis longicornis]|uniref:CCR4-NOT transcription complex subunit 7 n=1 Tax=Haemaphysalis longicornis TaxID=44386 RepID=A0A9J6GME6_HAELO|nr:hypothetical protein HPB48_008766 [Haemaphysalis longicornis]